MSDEEDLRLSIEYDDPQQGDWLAICTICGIHGDRTLRTDLTVVKQHWANRPLGQLVSRCPDHQTYWEKKMHEADMATAGR